MEEYSKLYCIPCEKKFANEHVFEHHKKGKNHIKEVNKMADKIEDINLCAVRVLLTIGIKREEFK